MFICRNCNLEFEDWQISNFNDLENKICKKCDGWPNYIECTECDNDIPVMKYRSDLANKKQVTVCIDCYSKDF